MGCVSSKVGQKPPDQTPGAHTAIKDDGGGESRAVESRPAQPVLESLGAEVVPMSKGRGKGEGRSQQQELRREGARRMEAGQEEETEGETITDATGLQMRTPRTCTDRGLHYAAKNGDLPLVHKLLGSSTACRDMGSQDKASPGRTSTSTPAAADLDERGMWGNTPLLVATQYAHPQVALALIAGGANACLENERRATALHYSCAEGLLEVSRALLENGAQVDPPIAAVHHPDVNGGQTVPVTPLSAASSGGHTELVRLLVECGAEVDRRVSPTRTSGQDRGASFSQSDGYGGSALTAAARYGHMETCRLLIDNGASVLLEDWDARTPLLHAILGGHTQTSLVLLDEAQKSGCERQLAEPGDLGMSGINPSGITALHAACENGLHEVVKALLAAGTHVDLRDGAGATPLLCACRKGRLQCVQELLSSGADPLAEDHDGSTPLSAAHGRILGRSGGEEILRLIDAAVANPESREDRPQPPPPRGKYDSQHGHRVEGDDRDEHEDEDVLLVSDWDDNLEGVDVLDDCDVLDGPWHIDHTDHHIENSAGQVPGHHTAQGQWPSTNAQDDHDSRGSDKAEDEDEDVLLVGDYDPTEEKAGLAGIPAQVTGSRRGSESLEVPSLSEENILQAQKSLSTSGTAISMSMVDRTLRHPDEDGEDRELRSAHPEKGEDGTKRDVDLRSEEAISLEDRPQSVTHEEGVPSPGGGAQRGGERHQHHDHHHDLEPGHLITRLSTHQVAADSVGMVLATAADRIVFVGQPEGGG